MTRKRQPTAAGTRRPRAGSGRSLAARMLAASELRYRRLFETAQDGILILNAETGVVVDVNPFLIRRLGYSREQLVGQAVWELGFMKDAIANRDKFLELQRQEYVRYDNLPLEAADGRRMDVEFVSNVYLVNREKVIQCNIRDITGRRQVQMRQELGSRILAILNRDREIDGLVGDLLRLIKEQTGIEAVGIRLRAGDDFPYVETNGFSPHFVEAEQQLCARDAAGDLVRDADGRPVLECMCGNVLSGRFDPSKPFFTPHGSFWTNSTTTLLASTSEPDCRALTRNRCNGEGYESVALVPLRSGAEVIGLLQFNDRRRGMLSLTLITFFEEVGESIGIAIARQRAAASLKESEARYRSLYVDSRDAILLISPERGLLGANAAATAMFACRDEQDLMNRLPASLSPERQPDGQVSADRIGKLMRLALESGSRSFAWTHRRADGTEFPATVLLSRVECGDQPFLQATVRDMTEQLRLEDQIRHAQKMEAVGRLAGGVAHDFNNMLMGIAGYVDLCRDHVGSDHPIREWLDEITHTVGRSAEITRQLLAFARKQAIAPKVLDLNDAVARMLTMLRRLIGEDINLVWLPGADPRLVKLDPPQVDQILANLCLNARDAIAGVGKITLETGNVTVDAGTCARHGDAVPGSYVFLSVSDDGAGMDSLALAHVFEPFFTTKGIGKGTGLGLATVYGIVKQNHGFIDVTSATVKGTTFKLYLPQAAAEIVDMPVPRVKKAPRGAKETILLVEDEKPVRLTCSRFLGAIGYTVLVAESPAEALELSVRHAGQIHLLLTDVIMPRMDGRQLAERIAAGRPDIKVLFMSGYPADVITKRGVLEEHTAFIAKPFTRDDLACKVRDVLEIREVAEVPA